MRKSVTKKHVLFTVGHSTRTIKEFITLLKAHGVETVADIRTIPRSRHNPQFNENRLHNSLEKIEIKYVHLETLGGLRHTKKDSKNTGWRNASFRGYADYMATPEFTSGLQTLEKLAEKSTTAIMCAEALPWRCHRSLVGDALSKRGWSVYDIMSESNAPKHRTTPFLKVRAGVLIYPAPKAA
ncbi:MAG: DUF488 domain-containing protein [Patescibacteria group bacterium]|nr:DUF488 domain-containing protein [Patescibacteria group bacterium]